MAKKILIIDDSREICELLEAMFAGSDFKVEFAYNGAEGLQKLAVFKPHLVILDVNMPMMDGFQFLEVMRCLPKFKETPVIMCTERQRVADYEKAFQKDVVEYVHKPFSREALMKKVLEILQ